MPIKSLLYRFQPAPLYVILVLSICYFSVQLVLSHITHALTLLMASYHMLCNIFALAGCIITIKQSNQNSDGDRCSPENCKKPLDVVTPAESKKETIDDGGGKNKKLSIISSSTPVPHDSGNKSLSKCKRREMKLRNTFGWARIDILAMLIVCIILASLSFSLLVEALQTLVHIDHQDTMHLPVPVMILGFVGLLLNGLTYLLIGGYTMHQGSFLQVTPSGTVVLDRTMSNSVDLALQPEERQLSSAKMAREQRSQDLELKKQLEREGITTVPVSDKVGVGVGIGVGGEYSDSSRMCALRRQGAAEMLRDISSTIFVIVCGFIVFMAEDEDHTAKFIDPVLSIFSCVLLVSLSYRYMKESCLILLQTIPDCIDMENFENTLIKRFPQIVSYHDLHIWQLAAHKYIATVHIQFQSPKLYIKAIDEVRNYFHDMGITEVTIQPEFFHQKTSSSILPASASASVSASGLSSATPSLECLMQCSAPECAEKVCCRDSRTELREVVSSSPIGSVKTEPKTKPDCNSFKNQQQQQEQQKQANGFESKILQGKSGGLIKKILPHFEITKYAERSKSTNDLVQSYKKTLEENGDNNCQQQTNNKTNSNTLDKNFERNYMKTKTASETNVNPNISNTNANIQMNQRTSQKDLNLYGSSLGSSA